MKEKSITHKILIVLLIAISVILILFSINKNTYHILAAENYNVTFHYNEEDFIVNVEENGLVEKIEDPKREGYIFLKWKDSRTLKEYDFSQPVTSDIRLVPEWKKADGPDLQKDVAGMIKDKDNKGENIFGLEETKDDNEFMIRLKDTKFIIICSVSMSIVFVIFIVVKVTLKDNSSSKKKKDKKKKNQNIEEHKEEKKIEIHCRRCGELLTGEENRCPVCQTNVLRK